MSNILKKKNTLKIVGQKSGNKCVKLCQVSNCKRPTNFFFIELTFSKTAYYELQYQHSMLILWLIDKKTTCS